MKRAMSNGVKASAVSRAVHEVCLCETLESRRLFASYYFSSVSGDDGFVTNDASHPWKTLTKANSLNLNGGDTLFFKAGETFNTTIPGGLVLDANDSGSPTSRVRITSYGTGGDGRATIKSVGDSHRGITVQNAEGIEIDHLNVVANTAGNHTHGIKFVNKTATQLQFVRISNVSVSKFGVALRPDAEPGEHGGNGILFVVEEGGIIGFKDVDITDSKFFENGDSGIRVEGRTGTGSNAFDRVQSINEDFYIARTETYDNTGIGLYLVPESDKGEFTGGNGIRLSNLNGGVVEDSVAYRNGNAGSGGLGIWAHDSTNLVFQRNEVYDNRTAGPRDGGGIGFDVNTSNAILQYNYSHDNDGHGLHLNDWHEDTHFQDVIVRYNISVNDGRKNGKGGLGIFGGIEHTDVYHNTIYMTPTAEPNQPAPQAVRAIHAVHNGGAPQKPLDLKIRNNIILADGAVPLVNVDWQIAGQGISSIQFQGNDYYNITTSAFSIKWGSSTPHPSLAAWRSATGQERNGAADTGLSSNPLLQSLGGADADSYRLQSASPMINAGLNLQTLFGVDPGDRDFFNTDITGVTQFDIGAHERTAGAAQSAYPSLPTIGAIPVTIQAENFDAGGEGVAYHDATTGNNTSDDPPYRSGVDVDIKSFADGWRLASASINEWTEYTIDVDTAGSYKLELRAANAQTGGTVHVDLDPGTAGFTNLTGPWFISNTGPTWNDMGTFDRIVNLPAGQHVLRLTLDTESAAAVDWLRLTRLQTPHGGNPVTIGSIPVTIEAENYDVGGEGFAYHDATPEDNGDDPPYRSGEDVDIKSFSGGRRLADASAGEWTEYSIYVTTAGDYTLDLNAGRALAGSGTLHVQLDADVFGGGTNLTNAWSITNTGGWDVMQTFSKTVALPVGQHVLRLYIDTGGAAAANWLRLTRI